MAKIVIRDEFLDFEIDGEVIAGPVSTEYDARDRRRPRWMEATLYAKAEGGYVLHQVNYSRVFHLADGEGHVRKPSDTRVQELPRDAVYCGDLAVRDNREQCAELPRSHRRLPGTVITEQAQHKAYTFEDEAAVIAEISTARRPNGTVSVSMSEPMRELLVEAERKVPAFGTARPVLTM